MIISRAPFRVTLGGGGTDLPSFYKDHGGFIFAVALDKYVNVVLNPSVVDARIRLQYLQSEVVDDVSLLRHPLAREALRLHGIEQAIELASIADLPARAGVGSSGSYLVAMLTALRAYKRQTCAPEVLAEEACHIEIDVLNEPVGKQDQYMAAFGGLRTLVIDRDGKVKTEIVPVSPWALYELVANMHVYYTGVERSASAILQAQNAATKQPGHENHAAVIESLLGIKELGYQILDAIKTENFDDFGRLLDKHWQHKKRMSRAISLGVVDQLYETVRNEYGVLGGKVIGAGGGGVSDVILPTGPSPPFRFYGEARNAQAPLCGRVSGRENCRRPSCLARSRHQPLEVGNGMKVFVAGGAGFIGSHTVNRLLKDSRVSSVTVYDNFSSGRMEHLPADAGARLNIVRAEISSMDQLCDAMAGHDTVFHYASNPDIAKAATEPDVDFWQGTYLTQNVVEAMRRTGARQIFYASGSGIYGDTGLTVLNEDHAPLLPISTYGASKLAGEMLICSYCHMFGMRGRVFRFANVVGPRQTHGVVFDFLRRLRADPTRLAILGNGTQSKSYIHVDDVLEGIWTAWEKTDSCYNYFNLATDDHITVTEIAALVVRVMDLKDVHFAYAGGDRGWKGDVPLVRMETAKMKRLGWKVSRSTHEAIESSIRDLYAEIS